MAKAEGKELVQALAFAHFAVYPNDKATNHQEKFLELFDPSVDIESTTKTKYKQHLSTSFPFDVLTRKTYIKGGKDGENDKTVRIVYDVAKSVYTKGIASVIKKPWANYEFLDQNDKFVTEIKDKVLKKVIDSLGMNLKADILSSADIFAVKTTSKSTIQTEIVDNHQNKEMILANMASGNNTIRTLTNKYFNSRELIPISLKLPETVKGTRYISIVGRTTGRYAEPMINDDIIDPYTKFLALLMNKKNNVKELIDDLITINFSNFRISSSRLNWEFPITFNYDKVRGNNSRGRENSNPISTIPYEFDLFAQGYGAGFNGQFKSGKTGSQWVGGAGIQSIEQFFNQYPEYSRVIDEVCDLRLEAFNYAIEGKASRSQSLQFGSNQLLKIKYIKALNQITKKHILYGTRENNVIDFFELLDSGYNPTFKSEKIIKKAKRLYDLPYSYMKYVAYFVKSAKSSMKNVTDTVFHQFLVGKGKAATSATTAQKMERLKAHYVHGQCSWFIMRGGPSLHGYLKKRMFLTVFGLITKKGYKVFNGDVDTKIKSAITKEFHANGKKLIAEFGTIPHLYLS